MRVSSQDNNFIQSVDMVYDHYSFRVNFEIVLAVDTNGKSWTIAVYSTPERAKLALNCLADMYRRHLLNPKDAMYKRYIFPTDKEFEKEGN